MEIKKRLPLFTALFVVIPLVILNLGLYFLTRDWVMETKKEQLETLVRISGDQLAQLMSDHWEDMDAAVRILAAELASGHEPSRNELAGFSSASPGGSPVLSLAGLKQESMLFNALGNIIASSGDLDVDSSIFDSQDMQALRKGRPVVTGLVRNHSGGEDFVLWCRPILTAGNDLAGIYGQTMGVSDLQNYTSNIRIGGTGYAYLTDRTGLILSHPDPTRIGTLTENLVLRDFLLQGDEALGSLSRVSLYEYRATVKYMAFRLQPDTRWFFVLNQTMDEIEIPVFRVLVISVGAFVLMVFTGIFLAIQLSNFITRPLDEMGQVMEAISNGDLDRQCRVRSEDELGSLARNLNNMVLQLAEARNRLGESQRALQVSEDRYRCAVDGAQDVIYDWDFLKQRLFISDKFQETFGMEFGSSTDLLEFFRHLSPGEDFSLLETEFDELMKRTRSVLRVELRVRSPGDLVWILLRGKIQWGPLGEAVRMSGSLTNISERKRREERIQRLAFFDSLTGLPNRQALMEQGPRILQSVGRDNFISGLVILDVDDLRKVNDSLGHEAGDLILAVISERLEFFSQAHPGYNGKPGTLYRFGGDEFVMVLPAFSGEEEVADYLKSIFSRISSAYAIGDKLMYINLSMGVALYPKDGSDVQELLRKADTALFAAKSGGKQRYAHYEDPMGLGLSWRLEMEDSLRHCLKHGLFEVHYQPLVDLASGRNFAFEALLRMPPDMMGGIGPAEFIPMAEKTGLIHEIGAFVMKTACERMAEWKKQALEVEYISVNVSPVQFMAPDFVENVLEICRNAGARPDWIQLEITETVLFTSFGMVVPALEILKEKGFRIALDDFGTGYSSLGYLRSIPLHCIKMDKSFIHDMEENPSSMVIARGIVQIARGMGLFVIAEGVESESQEKLLRDLGCHYGQGFHFGKAEPSDQADSRAGKPALS